MTSWQQLGAESAEKENERMRHQGEARRQQRANDSLQEIVDLLRTIDARFEKVDNLLSNIAAPIERTDDDDEILRLKSEVFNLRERIKIYKIHEEKLTPEQRIY